jgi:hypothetical protein
LTNLATATILYSPSAIDSYGDCQRQFWYGRNDDGSGRLPTDPLPAAVSSALHEALMDYHRQIEGLHLVGSLPDEAQAKAMLGGLLEKSLFRMHVDPADPAVQERLHKVQPGLERAAALTIQELPRWVVDGAVGLLVWPEARLDHGPGIRAVQLSSSVLVPTRPDIIGIRSDGGTLRAVVKDYKAKSRVVHPAFDNGILVRAFWALSEIQAPRCEWFLAGRDLKVDPEAIDVETVNLMQAGTADFLIRDTLTAEILIRHRDRLVAVAEEMALIDAEVEDTAVPASPSGLCHDWCPFLHRCDVGQAYIRKYQGDGTLEARLAEVP